MQRLGSPVAGQFDCQLGGDALDHTSVITNELLVGDHMRLDSLSIEPCLPGGVVLPDRLHQQSHLCDVLVWLLSDDIALLPVLGLLGSTPRDGLRRNVLAS